MNQCSTWMGNGTAYRRHLDRTCLGVVLNHICVCGSMCVCVCDYATLNALPSNIKYTSRGTALAMIYFIVENFLNWAVRYNVCYIFSTIEMPLHNINISLKLFPILPLCVHKWQHTVIGYVCLLFGWIWYGMVRCIYSIYIYIGLNNNHFTNKD